jgi:hypothetical protein
MPESMAGPNAASNDRQGLAQKCTKGWRKIHIGTDEEALEVRAIEVTSSSIGDAPMLNSGRFTPPSVMRPAGFEIILSVESLICGKNRFTLLERSG